MLKMIILYLHKLIFFESSNYNTFIFFIKEKTL